MNRIRGKAGNNAVAYVDSWNRYVPARWLRWPEILRGEVDFRRGPEQFRRRWLPWSRAR